jgi:hypothetical protein
VIVDAGCANVNARDHRGYTPLLEAARSGHCSIVQVLLEKDANVNDSDEVIEDIPLRVQYTKISYHHYVVS